jgi:hypothetical protein
MKQLLTTLCLIVGLSAAAQQPKPADTTAAKPVITAQIYTFSFSPAQLQQLWYIVDKSRAEHDVVAELQTFIGQQVEAQDQAAAKKKEQPKK